LLTMFKVRTMRSSDFAFAVELANTMDWNMATEDFQFQNSLEPEGCFVLTDEEKPVGIATCISYGEIGWFGNLIVKEECRKNGGGSTLVNHSVNYLRAKGVQTIGLYAYPHLIHFYSDIGFKGDKSFSVFHTEHLGHISTEKLPQIGKPQMSMINKFDTECFGGDRKRLLESIILEKGNVCHYFREAGEIVGYVAATVYESMAWIGPLVCKEARKDVSISLIKSALSKVEGKSVYAVAAKDNIAFQQLFGSLGFKEDFSVSRMLFGEETSKNCIYLAESLERG
jgi:predicted N-acetyltransferase YhbS